MITIELDDWNTEAVKEEPASDAELFEAVRAWALAWQGKEDDYKAEEVAFYNLADIADRWTGPDR